MPTDKGYRFFVDTLLKARAPLEDEPAFAELRRQLDAARDDPKALVAAASQLLSNVTQLAGVVTLPRTQQASITQIEFVGLSDNRALVVLVFNDREVQNRIIQLERYHSPTNCGAPPTSSPSAAAARRWRRCARKSCARCRKRANT